MHPSRLTLAILALLAGCESADAPNPLDGLPSAASSAPAPGGSTAPAPAATGGTAAPAGTMAATAGNGAGAGSAGSPIGGSSGPAGASAGAGAGTAGMDVPPADAGADADATPMGPATGTFPPIDDAWDRGPFEVATLRSAGPSRNATVLYPRDLGKDGLKHPIVVWDNGAGQTGLGIYGAILDHLASHGFAVYAAYSATDQGTELTQGIDWMIVQASASDSPFYEKLDTAKIAAMGHSQGSIATFAIADDPRLTTTIHLSGGTNPDIAEGHVTLSNLRNPAAFICGEPGGDGLFVGDTASEWCAYDFEHTDVPVFLAQINGASHITAPGMTLGACAGWLRWQLMADTTQRVMFAGPDCSLCMRPGWMVKEKGL